nr:unnamed protein product [Callosobruchus analis]
MYDIADYKHKAIRNEDKIELLEKFLVAPENFLFPLKKQRQHLRKFNFIWLREHTWLRYSKIEDGVFCKYCILFASNFAGRSGNQTLGHFVNNSYRNWKKTLQKFEEHERIDYHKFSVLSRFFKNQHGFELFINEAEGFVILADETADITNKEQLTICVRYLKQQNQICERFLQFVEITSATGANIAENILKTLAVLGVDCKYMCGQGYDGAAAMSAEKYPAAKYVYCGSHNLNLCLSSTCDVMEIRNCLGIIEKCYWFFDSPKRLHILQSNIDSLIPESKKAGLEKVIANKMA